MCWHVIGGGDSRPKVEHLIREHGVENGVILLGTSTNPYMRGCDIYVQPSYTEGCSTTFCEAGMLGKAIVGTRPSSGIYGQITDGEDGLIVDATAEGLMKGILHLIEDESIRHQFENNIQKKNLEGKEEIKKFLAVFSNETK